MRLVVNGCSHAAGAELEYPCQGQCYDKAWGKYLAQRLDFDYDNLSMSGASNHRIVRTTYEYLFEQIKKEKNIRDLFFVVMWPGFYRTEVHFDKKESYNFDNNWLPLIVGNDSSYFETFPKYLYEYYRGWTVFTDNTMSITDFYNDVLNLQNLFLRYKIKYLFLSATPGPADMAQSQEFHKYSLHVDKKKFDGFRDGNLSFTSKAHIAGKQISRFSVDSGFNSHYDEDTHKWYADYLFDLIQDKKLL
tara:strand:- start:650 stop:1390 length:741 start_codon:yes stop_codon:yes gene_type:complete